MTGKENRAPGILLIAPIQKTGASDTNVVGGNKVMADEQVRELGARDFEVDVIDTSGGVTNLPAWKIRVHRLARVLRVAWGAAGKLWRSDVVFLIIAPWSALSLASFLWVVCKMTRKPFVVRITGGDMMLEYLEYGAFARWLAERTWMRSSLVYVETQYLHRSFDNRGNFRWFPNTRSMEAPARTGRGRVEKLIFVARLDMDKGLAEALDACRHLPENCHLNVFGPGMSDTDFSLFEGHPRATYGGVLDPAEIPRVLSEHDLLVYPSYYRSEGYPGAILEAFQCGPARRRRQDGRRFRAGRARRERAVGGAPFRRRGRVRDQAVAGRARVVPAALRGSKTARGPLSERRLVRPRGRRPAQPVPEADPARAAGQTAMTPR